MFRGRLLSLVISNPTTRSCAFCFLAAPEKYTVYIVSIWHVSAQAKLKHGKMFGGVPAISGCRHVF